MEDGEIVEGLAMEEEPEPKNGKSPYEMLRETKSSVEEIVAQILSIKRDNKPKTELRELVTQMFLHFVTLRQANRTILLEEDRVKAETERAKAPVDFTTLQLHNLMYEKSHYVKAIKACKDFKSKYPDIDLVPDGEFLRDAPPHIKGPLLSHDSSHNLMLKRLNYELYQRKELCKLHEKLEQRKKSMLETIASRKKFLSSLPSHLKSLKKASLPVQNQLGVLHSKKLKQQNSAELLPPPLYVIYSQFMAQKEAFGECIDLEIVGSLKDAQAFARQQANKDSTGTSTNAETSRLEDDVPDEEDDGQRRRKRPRRIPSKENLDQTGVYQAHPLKITLHIYDDVSDPKSSKLITLKFEYLFRLNVVCVGVVVDGSHEGPENNILCNLFPDDTGVELPHQSAKLFVGDASAFDETRTSRPYKWAQHLAGIDFLPEVAPLHSGHETASTETAKNDVVVSGLSLYRQQNRVQTVVQRIRSRKRAQLALVEQLESLMKLKWPSLNCESVPWALHTPLCNLDGWSPAGPPPNQTSSEPVVDTDLVQEPMDVDVEGRSGLSKEESESAREDGELPSLAAPVVNDVKLTPSKISTIEHTKQLSLISKSMISPISKGKSLSFKKHDDDSDLLLDIDSDKDEIALLELGVENEASAQCHKMAEKLWVEYGVKEFSLFLSRKMSAEGRNVTLEAKVKISMEYPLRPPLFSMSLYSAGEKKEGSDGFEWCNELRAMEAEVNLYMLRMLPPDQDNYIIAHQVRCLAMLFDYFMDEASSCGKKSTSVVDVGLCKPVIGRLLARSFRGRDRRKMISWKDMECTSGYPY